MSRQPSYPLVRVTLAEEEWRTPRTRRSRGRACLWCRKACGHYPVQRMAPLSRAGTWTAPTRVRCHECAVALGVEQAMHVDRMTRLAEVQQLTLALGVEVRRAVRNCKRGMRGEGRAPRSK